MNWKIHQMGRWMGKLRTVKMELLKLLTMKIALFHEKVVPVLFPRIMRLKICNFQFEYQNLMEHFIASGIDIGPSLNLIKHTILKCKSGKLIKSCNNIHWAKCLKVFYNSTWWKRNDSVCWFVCTLPLQDGCQSRGSVRNEVKGKANAGERR